MPDRYLNAIAAGIRPDPLITYTEWADQYFELPKEAASEYGRYRSSRTPFVREVLDDLSPQSATQVVIVIKPTQCAGTTIGTIFMCGVADLYPGPLMMMMPTDAMARSFSKKKLANIIKSVPRLKDKIKEPKSRDSGNTILQKDFQGGSWMLTGSNSAASYRSESIKYLILDDFDGFEIDIEGEGSPEELADRRTGTFAGRKIYINSTTTVKETSNIERAFAHSSQGFFHVPCPHCGHIQYLIWGDKTSPGGIRFDRDEGGAVTEAWYQCEACQKRIDEHHKSAMLEAGRYAHKYPNRKVRGYKWNALHTPLGWVNSWAYIAQKFVEASHELRRGNPTKYKTWLNSFMSEAFEEKGEQPDWVRLKSQSSPYQHLTVPEKVRFLTSGTDVQHNRLAVSIWGWGAGEECWLVYHIEIAGDVMQPDVWEQHDQLVLNRTFARGETRLHILSAGVDAGDGQTTQAVRNYCRTRGPRIFALKGASTPGKPVIGIPTKQDIDWKGEKIEGGIEMWPVGSDTAKATLYGRLAIATPGPGHVHFYLGLPDEYFEQLTAEKIVTRFVKGYPVREWHNVRGNKRNEALDCFVYAYAAAIRAGLPFMDLEAKPAIKKEERQGRPPQRPVKKSRRW